MIIRYEQLLVAIIVADVNPLPAIPAPAPIPVRRGVVSERYAKEHEVIESIDEKTSVAETILKAVLNVVRADTLGQRLGFTPEPLLYLQVNVGNGVRSNTVTSKDSPRETLYVLNGVMTYGYK
ncbi:MAG: hypothetical protein WA231_08570 [Methylocella sp.]